MKAILALDPRDSQLFESYAGCGRRWGPDEGSGLDGGCPKPLRVFLASVLVVAPFKPSFWLEELNAGRAHDFNQALKLGEEVRALLWKGMNLIIGSPTAIPSFNCPRDIPSVPWSFIRSPATWDMMNWAPCLN